MKTYDIFKGRTVMVKTDVGVKVPLVVDSIKEGSVTWDTGPSTPENDWWPPSETRHFFVVKFTNGYTKEINSLNDIEIVD